MSVRVRFMQFYPKQMDRVVYLSHHSKNERSLNEPLKTPWHLMNHGICFRTAGADACFMPACGAFCLRNDEEVMGMLILGAVLVLLAADCLSVRQRLADGAGFDALEGLLDRIADSPTVEAVEAAKMRQKLAVRASKPKKRRVYRRWSKMCVCCPRRRFRYLSLRRKARMNPFGSLRTARPVACGCFVQVA